MELGINKHIVGFVQKHHIMNEYRISTPNGLVGCTTHLAKLSLTIQSVVPTVDGFHFFYKKHTCFPHKGPNIHAVFCRYTLKFGIRVP